MDFGSAGHVRLKLKEDAKILLRRLKSAQVSSPSTPSETFADKRRPTLTGCKKIVARKYYTSSKFASDALNHLERYADFNYSASAWSREYDVRWRLSTYKKQIAAIRKAESCKVRLKKCGDELGVNFDGFHFGAIAYMEAFPGVVSRTTFTAPNPIDFSEVSACGSFIDKIWSGTISTLAGAKLNQAKFYKSGCDGVMPGANFYCTDFSYSELSGVDLRFSYLRSCKFTGAVMHEADLRDSNIIDCCFRDTIGYYKTSALRQEGSELRRYFDEISRFSFLNGDRGL